MSAGGVLAQLREDLAPAPFRAALTWRIALLCALVSAAAMMFETPEAAISCYLIIFLMKPDPVQNIGTALGLIVLVTFVVVGVVGLINVTVEHPLLRLLSIALVSFIFLFIGSASQLGEIGGVIALVIAFVMTLVNLAPLGQLVTYGLREAWAMAVLPMALMAVFNLALGLPPKRLLLTEVRLRLAAAARTLRGASPAPALQALARDNAALEQQATFVKMLALVPSASAAQISRDVRASYGLLLAVLACPPSCGSDRRTALAAEIDRAGDALDAGHQPAPPAAAPNDAGPADAAARAALARIAGAPEGPVSRPAPVPFFAADAFTNPDHQRFALKTTAAAMICYLIYAGINWQGIHTAMITCYVAALSTTGETVHKLGLRIAGCLIGAAMGVLAILTVIPHLETVAGLMVLVFAGVLVGAWVSTGPERIAYGGVQIALAFLLTILHGYGPSLDLDAARDRIAGILLGNVVVYVIFTQVWPVSVVRSVQTSLGAAFAALAKAAALAPEQRADAVPLFAAALHAGGAAQEALDLVPYEPAALRVSPEAEQSLRAACTEIAPLAAALFVSRDTLTDGAEQLKALADRIEAGAAAALPPAPTGPESARARIHRLAAAADAGT